MEWVSGEPPINFFPMAYHQNHNYQYISMNLINNPIIPNPDPMKRIVSFHFRGSSIRQIFRKAINTIAYSPLVRFWNFFECFSCRSFELNSVFQMSSSSRSFSHEMLSPGSFRDFHASSISICSSISCKSFRSSIEIIAASASPRLVNTNASLPYATLLIIFANFFLASAADILFNMTHHLLYNLCILKHLYI